MMACHTKSGWWEWPPLAEALETAGLWIIKEYMQQCKSTVEAQVALWKIYELCKGAERMLGTSKFMQWWDQDVGREVE